MLQLWSPLTVFSDFIFSTYAWLFLTFLPPYFGVAGQVIDVNFWTITHAVWCIWVFHFNGVLTRLILVKSKGLEWYQTKFLPKISPISLIALLLPLSLCLA